MHCHATQCIKLAIGIPLYVTLHKALYNHLDTGGYVWAAFCLFVFLLVTLVIKLQIAMKLNGGVWSGKRNTWLNFGSNPDLDLAFAECWALSMMTVFCYLMAKEGHRMAIWMNQETLSITCAKEVCVPGVLLVVSCDANPCFAGWQNTICWYRNDLNSFFSRFLSLSANNESMSDVRLDPGSMISHQTMLVAWALYVDGMRVKDKCCHYQAKQIRFILCILLFSLICTYRHV